MYDRERQKDLILQLKAVKRERDLSCADIYGMVHDAGFSTSETSVRRVFAPESEDQNFRYQDTLQPIARVLLGVTEEGESMTATEADALKSIVLLKDSMIQDLQKENDLLLARIAQLERDIERMRVEEYELRIAEYKDSLQRVRERVEKLDAQINRKDEYIDRVAKKAGI